MRVRLLIIVTGFLISGLPLNAFAGSHPTVKRTDFEGVAYTCRPVESLKTFCPQFIHMAAALPQNNCLKELRGSGKPIAKSMIESCFLSSSGQKKFFEEIQILDLSYGCIQGHVDACKENNEKMFWESIQQQNLDEIISQSEVQTLCSKFLY